MKVWYEDIPEFAEGLSLFDDGFGNRIAYLPSGDKVVEAGDVEADANDLWGYVEVEDPEGSELYGPDDEIQFLPNGDMLVIPG